MIEYQIVVKNTVGFCGDSLCVLIWKNMHVVVYIKGKK